MLVSISQKRAWQALNYFTYMKSRYFKVYFCSFSSKSYYFYILGVSHLKYSTDRVPLRTIPASLYWCGLKSPPSEERMSNTAYKLLLAPTNRLQIAKGCYIIHKVMGTRAMRNVFLCGHVGCVHIILEAWIYVAIIIKHLPHDRPRHRHECSMT